jgi:Na+/H+ antiporter NhaD/arsenite permease-like protein
MDRGLALIVLGGRPNDAAYFWPTRLLSSVLDNAPTYLVFFNVVGSDAETLMGPLARTRLAVCRRGGDPQRGSDRRRPQPQL